MAEKSFKLTEEDEMAGAIALSLMEAEEKEWYCAELRWQAESEQLAQQEADELTEAIALSLIEAKTAARKRNLDTVEHFQSKRLYATFNKWLAAAAVYKKQKKARMKAEEFLARKKAKEEDADNAFLDIDNVIEIIQKADECVMCGKQGPCNPRWHTHRMNGFRAGGCTKCHSCGQDNMYIHWCGVDYTDPTYCEGWCGYVYCQNPSRKCAELIAKARFWRKNRPIRHLFKKFIKTWKDNKL